MSDRGGDKLADLFQQRQAAWGAQWNQHWNQVFLATGDPARATTYANAMMRPLGHPFGQTGAVAGQGNRVGPQPPGQETPLPVAYEPAGISGARRVEGPPPMRVGASLFPQSISETGAYRVAPAPPAPDAWAQDVRSSPAFGDFVARLMRRWQP